MEDALAIPEFKEVYDSTPHLHELIDIAARMEGTVRNAGTHAAGVVISDKPILEYLPLHRPNLQLGRDADQNRDAIRNGHSQFAGHVESGFPRADHIKRDGKSLRHDRETSRRSSRFE